jgi:hypothetical protein
MPLDPQLLEQAVAAMEGLGWSGRIITPTHNEGQLLAFKNFKQLDDEGDLWIWVDGSDIENAQALIALGDFILKETKFFMETIESLVTGTARYSCRWGNKFEFITTGTSRTEAVLRAFIAVSGAEKS